MSHAIERTQVFGADWCADCRRTKSWLRRHDVPFVEFDTDADPAMRTRAAEIAGGRTNIPVVVTPEGTVLVEPTNVELAEALAAHGRPRGRSGCR
ncbi:glutaredoxin family protein [Actinophytocola sp.]|uniref:glutaredoxin family protein n=1 Tax=Actinophytocola sp. TaxID=1872138 RepID=UPI002ED11898